MKETFINVVLYIRVSTDEQAQQGFSSDYQEESLRRYCKQMGYTILNTYREDHSAKNFNRPQWKQLHSFVKANKKEVDKVLFVKWDRFSRSSEHAYSILAEYKKMDIELNAIEQLLDMSIPENKFILSTYLSMGEVERDKISDRTLMGTFQAKTEGYYAGRAPYGYDNYRDGAKSLRGASKGKRSTLMPNSDAHFITKAFNEVALNIESVEAIRLRLNGEGMKLGRSMFNDSLKNIVYAGKIIVPEYKKIEACVVDGKHAPLIDMETFGKVQAIFTGKRWHGIKPSHKNREFPLRDFFLCATCGKQITGSITKGRSKRYAYYHCRKKCDTRVTAEKAHAMFSRLLTNLQINTNVKDLFKEVVMDSIAQAECDKSRVLIKKVEQRDNIKRRITEVENKFGDGDISAESFNNMMNRFKSDLRTMNADIEELGENKGSIKDYVNDAMDMLLNLNMLFAESDYEGKRVVAGSVFNQKLQFGNNGCRTTSLNQVLELFARNGNGSGGGEKGKAIISDSFSANVPRAGVEPAYP